MVKHIFIILLACICNKVVGQDRVENIDVYIYNEVYKNIAAYNIRYASYNFNGVFFKERFRANSDFFYHWFLADRGYRLDMQITECDSTYPNTKFRLYKIHLRGFSYIPDDHALPSIGSLGPRTLDDFLIGLNVENGDIKFISGQFFKSYISDDFPIDKNDPESLVPYLTLRAFDVGGTNIKLKKKRRKKWIFEGYSEIYKGSMIITVYKNDIDRTKTIVNAKL